MSDPIGIHASPEQYRDLVLQMTNGDFASGQRWLDITDTAVPTTVTTFAEGQEGHFARPN